MTQNPKFDAGKIILLTEGEFSNYSVGPLFRCLRDLNLKDLSRDFYSNAPLDKLGFPQADASTFALWLVQNGWVEEMEYSKVSVGSCGEFGCFDF